MHPGADDSDLPGRLRVGWYSVQRVRDSEEDGQKSERGGGERGPARGLHQHL